MKLCYQCKKALESREGNMPMAIIYDENGICDWCQEPNEEFYTDLLMEQQETM